MADSAAETSRRARSFYTVFIVSVAIGIALDLLHVNPTKQVGSEASRE